MMRVLVTGGCGFVGHHVVEHLLKNTDWEICILDKLSYSSTGFDRLRDISVYTPDRVKVFSSDLTMPVSEGTRRELGDIDLIFHLAAESHVDKSIENPEPFVLSNVLGTMNILNYARTLPLSAFFYFSTDEVFGPAPEGVKYKEWDRYKSGNPYAATKAGGEELALSYHNTYGLPVIITHTMNVFGERQHPEKFIPKVIRACLNGDKVFIHADKTKTKAGSRFWIHGRNVGDALLFLARKGEDGDKYNIVGQREIDNQEMALKISAILGEPLDYELTDFHSSRPGHDLRYALDGTKMKELGWEPPVDFDESLRRTVEWTVQHRRWLDI